MTTQDNPRIAAFTNSLTFASQTEAEAALTKEDKAEMREAVIAWLRDKENQGAFLHDNTVDVCKDRKVTKIRFETYVVKQFSLRGTWHDALAINASNSSWFYYCLFYKYLFRP